MLRRNIRSSLPAQFAILSLMHALVYGSGSKDTLFAIILIIGCIGIMANRNNCTTTTMPLIRLSVEANLLIIYKIQYPESTTSPGVLISFFSMNCIANYIDCMYLDKIFTMEHFAIETLAILSCAMMPRMIASMVIAILVLPAWYALRDPQHKQKCTGCAAVMYQDEKLFKEPPPRKECPICMLPLPINANGRNYKYCCDQTICTGCTYAMLLENHLALDHSELNEEVGICPFCRDPRAGSLDKGIKELNKHIERGSANACFALGGMYDKGVYGMPQDYAKANELFLKSGELGCAEAYNNLGHNYENGLGVEVDEEKTIEFYELAATKGDVNARHNLGVLELQNDNVKRAMKHFIIAARTGGTESLDVFKQGFMSGFVSKDEYEETARTCQTQQDGMKSDMRDKAVQMQLQLDEATQVHSKNLWK